MTRFDVDSRSLNAARQARLRILGGEVTVGVPSGLDEEGNGVPFWDDWRWTPEDVDLMAVYVNNPGRLDAVLDQLGDDATPTEIRVAARAASAAELAAERSRRDGAD